jgi:uncharacterized membrane protein
MSMMRRLAQNAFSGWFQLSRHFPPALLDQVASKVAVGETTHRGEVRIAIESRLPLGLVFDGMTAHDRAKQAFAQLRVWDTEQNCGVLLYVLLAEHHIEVVADRGIAARVDSSAWEGLCAAMREHFAGGRYGEGLKQGVAAANALLAEHFPGDGTPRVDELPDRPILL